MRIAYTPEQERLRRELRAYFGGLMTPEVRAALSAGDGDDGDHGDGQAYRQVVRQLGRDGWLALGWPEEYGGRGRTTLDQLIFGDEAAAARVPVPFLTINTVGPTIMRFGTPEQKAFYLPKIAAGEIHFSIGYSEPEAGTDLASLRTAAVRDGDQYVIDGQKMWTSLIQYADYVWLACRTDPAAERHKGLSIIIVPTDAPGRSDRAGAPGRAHPDLRRRHQRGTARHHRGRRARPSAGPPLGGAHGLHAQRSAAGAGRAGQEDPGRAGRALGRPGRGGRARGRVARDARRAGLGLLEQCSVLIELGRAASDVPYLASIVLGAGALAEFGSAEQRRRWAVPAGRGSVVLTAALAEEDGDDPRWPSASAVRAADRWVLSGVKTAVPAAPAADLFLVPAAVPGGVLVFLVLPSDDGVRVEPQRLTDFAEAGRIVLDGVALDEDRALGGAEAAGWLVSRATVGLCAAQSGVIDRALELTAEHARSRVQFGRPIGSFQAVTQRLADAHIDTEAVRLTMWQAAWLLASGDAAADVAVATAKFWAADAGHRVAHTAVHVHGGLGIDTSYPVHRYFAAAKHHEFALG